MRLILSEDAWCPVGHDIEDVLRLLEWENKGYMRFGNSDLVNEWRRIWRKLR